MELTIISSEAKTWIEPMLPELREWRETELPKKVSDPDLFKEIEGKFGNRILQDISLPHKLGHAASVLLVMEALKTL